MSATRLLILGALVERGVAHGYQIRKDLESWQVDLWGNIGKGSVYHGLRQLATDGLIKPAGPEPAGSEPADSHGSHSSTVRASGPARQQYAVTTAGRGEFQTLLEKALSTDSRDLSATMAGVGFMTVLSRSRVIELLELRIEALQTRRERVVSEYERRPDEDWAHHVEAIRLWASSADSAIAWTEGLIARLRSGDYTMADERSED